MARLVVGRLANWEWVVVVVVSVFEGGYLALRSFVVLVFGYLAVWLMRIEKFLLSNPQRLHIPTAGGLEHSKVIVI